MRAAVYARVCTADQTFENQLRELRAYCDARGLTATEYVDSGCQRGEGVSPGAGCPAEGCARGGSLVCWSCGSWTALVGACVI